MGKNTNDRPAYLTSDDAKYSLGVHRGPMLAKELNESSALEQVESARGLSLQTQKRTRKEKLARHWKRFWCIYLFANIIFLTIFLPIFFLVAIPAISQLVVDKSDLVLVRAAVMQPQPSSIRLTLQSALDLKIALPVRIEPIELDLFVRDRGASSPWGEATIPGMTIKGNTTLGVSDTHTPLQNLSTWVNYVQSVVFQEESTLSIKGTTNSYLGVLKSKVTMNKDVTSPALNQFTGFSISDSGLVARRSDGTNLVGNATLPNPSVLTLEVGTIVLDVKSGDLVIGNATLTDVTLVPGSNTFPLTGILDFGTIFSHLEEVLSSQASLLKTGNLTLDTVTRSVTWNSTRVPYYTEVMSQLTLTANVPIAGLLKNSIHNLIGSSEEISSLLRSSSQNNSISSISSLLNNTGSNNTSSLKSEGSELASKIKSHVAVRDLLRDAHPVKRDMIIDSVAEIYAKL
ncbi:hypothetical protein N7467_008141 [Penicillium canescens]|nr:hypothetical protein N7467_008141 [Penicillium canescens]